MSLQTADAARADVVLFGCNWRVFPNHSVSCYESHNKQFLMSERINSILCSANLSILESRMLKTNYCRKTTFCTLQGTVIIFYRCGKQKQKHLHEISSGLRMPKIIKICPFMTELFKIRYIKWAIFWNTVYMSTCIPLNRQMLEMFA